jgi:H+/Cl- antiporter ClcA
MTLAFNRLIPFPPLRTMLGGLIILVAIWFSGTTNYIGLGIPTIVAAFEVKALFYVFLIKILLTVITLGSGFKGGEVTPLFFIGATFGSALSTIIPLPTALLAGLGFVAVFGGATNAPIACTIMAIELFGHQIGIYAGIACFSSYLSSSKFSIYEIFDGKSRNHFIKDLFRFSIKY